ncbi:MAG: cadherin domain-containing protein, partial [Dolichospermum sp.]
MSSQLTSGVVSFADPFNDDRLVLLSAITLAVNPTSVTEDGTANLVYTFTRTGAISNALTVNYTVSGTAIFNSDYTQTGATAYTTTTGTVTFAAGASTATVTIDPTNDAEVESDETVALTLASGTGYSIATTNAVTGTILNNDAPTNLILANRNILEDQPVGTVVSELISTDPDTGNTFTYSLVAGTGSTDNNAFTITNNQLKTNAVFDFETKNSYNIRLRTTDQGGLSFERAFTIGVISSATPTQIVTTLQDITSSTDGFLSLREAIAQANNANVNGTILLGEGRYTLATADDLDIQLQGKTLTIQGQGKDLTILDGNSLDRFFEVHSGATVILSGVTITNGKADFGGAIYNSGNLSISDSKIENNQALGMNGVNGAAGSDGYPDWGNPGPGGTGGSGSSGGDAGGGAIYNGGIITIINTAISNNQAIGGRGGNGGSGGSGSSPAFFGAPFIGGRGGDGGNGGNGGDAWGGGLFNAGQATLTNITVGSHSVTAGTGGSAGSGGSGQWSQSGTSYSGNGSPGIAGVGGDAWGRFIYNVNSGSISSNGTLNGVFNAGGSVVANDWAVVTVAAAPVSVTEDGSSNLVYTFTRTGSTTNTLTVNYTVGGTATLGTDYTGISTTGAT